MQLTEERERERERKREREKREGEREKTGRQMCQVLTRDQGGERKSSRFDSASACQREKERERERNKFQAPTKRRLE